MCGEKCLLGSACRRYEASPEILSSRRQGALCLGPAVEPWRPMMTAQFSPVCVDGLPVLPVQGPAALGLLWRLGASDVVAAHVICLDLGKHKIERLPMSSWIFCLHFRWITRGPVGMVLLVAWMSQSLLQDPQEKRDLSTSTEHGNSKGDFKEDVWWEDRVTWLPCYGCSSKLCMMFETVARTRMRVYWWAPVC